MSKTSTIIAPGKPYRGTLRLLAVCFLCVGFLVMAAGYLRMRRVAEPDALPGQQLVSDLGVQASGNVLKHRFYVRNPGENNIKVESVRTSCGCTAVSTLPAELVPGQRYPLDMEINTSDRKGSWLFSSVVSFAGQAQIVLTVHADLENRLPEQIDFGKQLRGAPAGMRMRVIPIAANEHLAIDNISFDERYFLVTHGVAEDGQSWIEVKLNPTIPEGGFYKDIYVRFAGREPIAHTIHARGWVERDVEADPSEINFGTVDSSRSSEVKTISLYSPYGKSINVVRVESDLPDVLKIAAKRPSKDGHAIELELQLDVNQIHSLQVFDAHVITECDDKMVSTPLRIYAGRISRTN